LLSAVDHCAKKNVINRDIKPENIMFSSPSPDSPLRLIDFGSGTDRVVDGLHTTFAGTAFYISPEMFQNTYTQKTDVWSVGVCLYVLVAGYPSAKLQTAFNLIHNITPGERKLKDLPNMPDNLPDSYYKMLKELLEYKHKKRKTATQILESSDFVRFHTFASSVKKSNIIGSVGRHSLFLDYQKFERSLTTLLATMLSKSELTVFVQTVHSETEQKQLDKKQVEQLEQIPKQIGGEVANEETKEEAAEDNSKSLDVVTVKRVVEILKERGNEQVISMMQKLPGSDLYDFFAYDIRVLKYFVRDGSDRKQKTQTAKRRASRSRASLFGKIRLGIDSSLHSVSGRIRAGLDFSGHSSNSGRMRPSSMDGSNHSYNTKKTTRIKTGFASERKPNGRTSPFL
jgi:serine/threonine protein kinase